MRVELNPYVHFGESALAVNGVVESSVAGQRLPCCLKLLAYRECECAVIMLLRSVREQLLCFAHSCEHGASPVNLKRSTGNL